MKKTAKKTGWGGPRPGAGIKKIGKDVRVTISISIDPTELKKIDAYAKRQGISRSMAIERLCLVGLKQD